MAGGGPKDEDSSPEMPVVEGEAKKLVEHLQFKNPGPHLRGFAEFNPEESTRELRKLNRLLCSASSAEGKAGSGKRGAHDKSGRLLSNNFIDLCDCQDENCTGCHWPCASCGSEKCGVECRCDRKWTYCKEVATVDPFLKVSSNHKENGKGKAKYQEKL